MLRDKTGNRLFRSVKIKIEFPNDIFPPKVMISHAGAKQGFGPSGIDDLLMQTADQLDTLHPYWNFEMLELAPEHRTARYLFKFAGYNTDYHPSPAPEVQIAPGQVTGDFISKRQPNAESTAPDFEAAAGQPPIEVGNTL